MQKSTLCIKAVFALTAAIILLSVVISCANPNLLHQNDYQTLFFKDDDTVIETQKVKTGTNPLVPQNPQKDDHQFIRWYSDKNKTKEFDFNVPITRTTVAYACFEKIVKNTYTVSYVVTDGFLKAGDKATQLVTEGENAKQPSDPTRPGYIFSGWYEDADCTTLFDFSKKIADNTFVYAGWSDKTYYTVTFNENYVKAGTSAQTVTITTVAGEALSFIYSPNRYGKKFTGWYTSKVCTQATLFDSNTPITKDTVLYAGWRDLAIFSVTIYYVHQYSHSSLVNAGLLPKSIVINVLEDQSPTPYQLAAIFPPDFILYLQNRREIYAFYCFYTSLEAYGRCYNPNDPSFFNPHAPISKSLTLYACWVQQIVF